MTKWSMRHPLAASEPAATAASTAAVSPPIRTMYLPEQIERDNIRRTLPAFNIVSATWNPAAMLDSSIKPIDFSIILPFKHNSLVRDLPYCSGQRRVQCRAQRIRGGLSDEVASRDPVAGLHFGQAGRAGALFERQQQPTGFEPARPQRRRQIIVMHVEFPGEGLDWDMAAIPHRVRLHGGRSRPFHVRPPHLGLRVVAGFFGV